MTLSQRFPALLFEPDYATSDLYENPALGQAFTMVTMYALFSSFNAFLSAAIKAESLSFALFAFFFSFALAYISWFVLAFILHIAADLIGGIGEIPNAIAFTGLGTAPLVITSVVAIFLTMIGPEIFEDDSDGILSTIVFCINLLGIAWGWTGVLCYFGLKNAERLSSWKALILSFAVFIVFSTIEALNSDIL
jgi:hypothetical protein